MQSYWPVAVVPVGDVACGTTLWRAKGRLHVTVVAKACFRLVQGAAMARAAAEPVRADRGETAPYLTQAGVVITAAHAYPRNAMPAPALAVRLAVFREWAVIDKSLLVYAADEEGRRAHAITGEVPVVRGEGSQKPMGILIDPREARRPGSLGPLNEHARRAVLKDAAGPVAHAGVMEIPDLFPWSYFQVAPVDQRTSYLQGDEWIVLDGMDREHPRLQSQLPRALASVFVYPPGLANGSSYPVHMEADQLTVDVEARTCALLWRGSFPVDSVATARSLILVAGVHSPDAPLQWPDLPALMASPVLRAHGLVQSTPLAPHSAEARSGVGVPRSTEAVSVTGGAPPHSAEASIASGAPRSAEAISVTGGGPRAAEAPSGTVDPHSAEARSGTADPRSAEARSGTAAPRSAEAPSAPPPVASALPEVTYEMPAGSAESHASGRNMVSPNASAAGEEDAFSLAKTRNVSPSDAAAMFAELENEEEPASMRSAAVGQLEMSMEGVLSVHTATESVMLEVLKLIGEEPEVQVTDAAGTRKRRTALGLPAPDRSRALRPMGIVPQPAENTQPAHAHGVSAEPASAALPDLDDPSVDELELTLSDALDAEGVSDVDELIRRRGRSGHSDPTEPSPSS